MTIKTAVSLPKNSYVILERLRKQWKISRSATIQRLITDWFEHTEEKELIQRYVLGYQQEPEDLEELKAMSKGSAEAFHSEGLK